jgi:hypothetical protein
VGRLITSDAAASHPPIFACHQYWDTVAQVDLGGSLFLP